MNCQDFNQLMDSDSPGGHAPLLCEEIDQHLASCRTCREEWTNWRDMAALEVPATPVALRARIASALPTSRNAGRNFRPYLVGGVLLVSAAAAAVMAWRSAGPVRESAPSIGESPLQSASVESTALQPDRSEQAADAMEEAAAPEAAAPAAISAKEGSSGPVDPRRILVWFRPETGADPGAIASASQCHDALVSRLRTVPQFEVLADGAVLPQGASMYTLAPDEAKRALDRGVGHVLLVSTEMGCDAILLSTQTGMLVSGVGGQLLPRDGYVPSATGIVQSIREKLLENPASLWAEARAKLLDPSLGDRERINQLGRFRQLSMAFQERRTLDAEIVAAAVHLGATSSDAKVRESVWVGLRNVRDPQIIPPLLKALASDADATVRMQVVFTLRPFLDAPGVREALLRAAAEDPDSEAEVFCCTYTVREAAERAAVSDKDFSEWVRSRLYDENLPARSRLKPLAPSSMDGRFLFLSSVDYGEEAARVVFDIGRSSPDPKVRTAAWDILFHAKPDTAFLPQLLTDLSGNPDEYVRANAARLLGRHASEPEVRKALEKALEDPSMQVRIAANGSDRPFRE